MIPWNCIGRNLVVGMVSVLVHADLAAHFPQYEPFINDLCMCGYGWYVGFNHRKLEEELQS